MVTIGDRIVGDDQPTYITFEAGPTHDGFESAKRLTKLAAESGADAIKFQVFDPDRLVSDKQQPFTYSILADPETGRLETVTEPLYDILCRRALQEREWRELKTFSDSLGLSFFATVAFEEDVDLLENIGCHSIKIASADINHIPLIRYAARTGLSLQIDTGNGTIGEIEVAVDTILSEGNTNIVIHHCPSGYPARLESINLNIIPTLKQMFHCAVAYSDHTPGWEMDVAAVAMGAHLVEKTITEDRTTASGEHVMSLEPNEMLQFVQRIRDVEVAMGETRRLLHPEENERRSLVRRSLHLTSAVRAGQRLGDASFDFRRPGTGIAPNAFEHLLDRTFREDLPAGRIIMEDDLDPPRATEAGV